jgi:hypothetical protein
MFGMLAAGIIDEGRVDRDFGDVTVVDTYEN